MICNNGQVESFEMLRFHEPGDFDLENQNLGDIRGGKYLQMQNIHSETPLDQTLPSSVKQFYPTRSHPTHGSLSLTLK
jgi:hypothetical protein